jgi:hypothetical protein
MGKFDNDFQETPTHQNNTLYLIFSESKGFIGSYDYYGCLEDDDQIVVRVDVNIPKSLYNPVKLVVDVPEDFVRNEPIRGQVDEVSIPVTVDDIKPNPNLKEEMVVKEALDITSPSWGSIIGLIRKKLIGSEK